jgi:3-dehydroquinate synthetase
MKAWISNEKELIRNYENELKRLIKQDSQRKMDIVGEDNYDKPIH